MLGTDANGHWQIAPAGEARRVERRYRPGTLVLETDFETDDGLVRLVDCMPLGEYNNVVRIVEGLRGRVAMQMQVQAEIRLRPPHPGDRPDRPGHLRRGRAGRGLHAYDRGDERGGRRGIGGVHGLGR